jgi:hypothetical protein
MAGLNNVGGGGFPGASLFGAMSGTGGPTPAGMNQAIKDVTKALTDVLDGKVSQGGFADLNKKLAGQLNQDFQRSSNNGGGISKTDLANELNEVGSMAGLAGPGFTAGSKGGNASITPQQLANELKEIGQQAGLSGPGFGSSGPGTADDQQLQDLIQQILSSITSGSGGGSANGCAKNKDADKSHHKKDHKQTHNGNYDPKTKELVGLMAMVVELVLHSGLLGQGGGAGAGAGAGGGLQPIQGGGGAKK